MNAPGTRRREPVRAPEKTQVWEEDMQIAERRIPNLVSALPGPKAKEVIERDRKVV